MLKHFPYEKLEYALDLYIASAEKHVEPVQSGGPPDAHSGVPEEDCLMTIKEAVAALSVSRYTVDAMRKRGQLTTICHNKRVRLLRQEVDEARRWYSVMKGKV